MPSKTPRQAALSDDLERTSPEIPVSVHTSTLWETGGFQKASYQHVDTVT